MTTSPMVVSTDGVARSWDEVFATDWSQPHRLSDVRGYVVRRTFFDRSRPHEDVATFTYEGVGPNAFELATTLRGEVIEQQGSAGHGVIDRLYACGDRGQA